ncbi:MAG TPA: sugar kinase [Puia sp.]|nr:sugar kinase [Puia sp.]
MNKVFCFGEILLRMSPALQGEWLRKSAMDLYLGGSELNVAAALARWKIPAKYFTAMPENYLSGEIVKELSERNIDTSAIHLSGERIGIYFLPQGADLKHKGVIYDRAHSSFSECRTGMIDWDRALEGVSWFHFSAVSPALGKETFSFCREALEAAVKKRITISVDLNYRARLWQNSGQSAGTMGELAFYCDVIMGNIWSAHVLLGVEPDPALQEKSKKEDYLDHALKTCDAIYKKFPQCKTIANTFRFDHGQSGIQYYAALFRNNEYYVSEEFIAENIVDKVGTGDCFMAGLIYGLYHDHTPKEIINFAAAAAVGKFYELGDITKQDIAAIQSRIKKHG